ncbi:MAG: adenylyl-sulfate kinase [Methylophaga sp.]
MSTNVVWQNYAVSRDQRAERKKQKPCILWFTGLSASGKSTTANQVERLLFEMGHHTYLLDGDNVRHGLNKDLGFGDADRVENIRRIGELSKLFADAGLIVLSAFISPFRSDRQMVRDLMPEGEFVEIFMNTPMVVCEQRDPKGLYQKARRGEIKNFTGIDSAYEPPEQPEITLNTAECSVEDCAKQVIEYLRSQHIIRE